MECLLLRTKAQRFLLQAIVYLLMIPVSRMLIYTKLIDKMEIKSRINLSTHVSMCTKKKKKSDMTLSILQPFQANCIHVLHIQVFGSHQIITKMLENSLSL